jgi:hypothetical protein
VEQDADEVGTGPQMVVAQVETEACARSSDFFPRSGFSSPIFSDLHFLVFPILIVFFFSVHGFYRLIP